MAKSDKYSEGTRVEEVSVPHKTGRVIRRTAYEIGWRGRGRGETPRSGYGMMPAPWNADRPVFIEWDNDEVGWRNEDEIRAVPAKTGELQLHVYTGPDHDGQPTNVWAGNVPAGMTDREVELSVRQAADRGDETARVALRVVHAPWFNLSSRSRKLMNSEVTDRVYLDR